MSAMRYVYWGSRYCYREPYRRDNSLIGRVWDEMTRAIEKHGLEQTPANPNMNLHEKMTILTEEVGEVARATTYDEGSRENRIKELIQVATMALMWAAAEVAEDD